MKFKKSVGRARVEMLKHVMAAGYQVDSSGRVVHREICKKAHGRFPKDWIVHHIDENKSNNDPQNLIAMPRRMHDSMHSAMAQKKCTFTRKNIEDMVRSYVNLTKGRDAPVIITVVIDSSQVKPDTAT